MKNQQNIQPPLDKHGDVDYYPEENGWEEGPEHYAKGPWLIWWDHHCLAVCKNGSTVDLNPFHRNLYYTTAESLAWEIDNGIYPNE